MKVIVKKFSTDISSWSNQEVAEFLNKVIDPNNPDQLIKKLNSDQLDQIRKSLGSEPKLPAKFKDIYQQFKGSKIIISKRTYNLRPSKMWYYHDYYDNKGNTWKGKYAGALYKAFIDKGKVVDNPEWPSVGKLYNDNGIKFLNNLIDDNLLSVLSNISKKDRSIIEILINAPIKEDIKLMISEDEYGGGNLEMPIFFIKFSVKKKYVKILNPDYEVIKEHKGNVEIIIEKLLNEYVKKLNEDLN